MYVTNYNLAVVYSNDGTIVFNAYPTNYSVKDSNGNFFSQDSNSNVIDTLNRTLVTVTAQGSTYYYDVLNSKGSTSRYTVNTANIDVCTNFGQAGVTEYCSAGNPGYQVSVIQSISLPDGTAYSFNYDSGTSPGHYGELTSVTLPTGGQLSYTWTKFFDAYGNANEGLNSRSSGGGTWTYTPAVISSCPSGHVGCQQKVTEVKPSGDNTVYTFTLNNGAWNTETQYYTGASTLLRKVASTYDFSNSCPVTGCTGAAYVRRTQVVTTDPAGATTPTKQTQYAYDSPQNGNVTAIKEWKYYTGSPPTNPDRETDFTYLSSSSYVSKNIINLVTDEVVKNSAGTKMAETITMYDSTSLTSVTGITHHDNTNYGAGNTVRGNPTVVKQWVSGSTYLTATNYYDTPGHLIKTNDPKGNKTLYSYSDNFFNDASPPSNPPASYTPPAPTNAYRTQTTLPVSGTQSFGYYFGDGKPAVATDPNNVSTYDHYLDSLDRETHTYLPAGGWKLASYTSATQQDVYTGLTDTTPSTSCTGCRHDQVNLDGLGRQTSKVLVSDPRSDDGSDNLRVLRARFYP